MPLQPGTTLGPYRVTAKIGEGGMGEVYRARDTNLDRDVAIKVLPEAFTSDPDRLARFEREAKVLASLNHPNIGAIYGLEKSGDTRALVLELIEGPTLAERIKQGPIPVDEALRIAKQIAEALEAAHEQGIIHRDLKPANIKVKDDGTVKVLDFGLAKALDRTPSGDPSESPTLTASATALGVIMGTAAYMSPEQARGRPVDKRSDIWAFGAVLYEMLSGKRPFEGRDVSETLGAVLRLEPDWNMLPDDTPPRLSTLLRRCLEKEPKERVHDVADVRLAMAGGFESLVRVSSDEVVAPQFQVWQRPIPLVLAGLGLIVVSGLAGWALTRPEVVPQDPVRFAIVPRPPLGSGGVNVRRLAMSRDGSQIVYSAQGGGFQLHRLDQLTGAPLRGGEDGFGPFLSPDGQWVGFTDGPSRVLQKVSLFGGPPVFLTEALSVIRGKSWGADDQIIFGTGVVGASSGSVPGLFRVSGGGGQPERLTSLEQGETSHSWPFIIPDREAVLFSISTGAVLTTGELAVLDLDTSEVTRLGVPGVSPHYVSTGYVVYASGDRSIRAVPFDATSLTVTGNPVPLVEGIDTPVTGAANFDISDNGRLVYLLDSSSGSAPRTLVWVDREGREEPITMPPRPYYAARLSPDGTRVAVEVREENTDIWVHDLARGTQRRLTFDPGADRVPVWTPDGERIAFSSDRDGPNRDIYWKLATGTGQSEPILSYSERPLDPWSWTPDGQSLLINENGRYVSMVTLGGDQTRQLVLEDDFPQGTPEISPDGRWMAYRANESGQVEIYVRPFPDIAGGKWQVSTEGGNYPAWSPDGRELFYRTLDGAAVMAVTVETEPTFSAGTPDPVIEGNYVYAPGQGRNFDISPDGQRFLMLKNVGESGTEDGAPLQINVVLNWFQELTERVPVP